MEKQGHEVQVENGHKATLDGEIIELSLCSQNLNRTVVHLP